MIRLLATDLDATFWGPDLVPPKEHVDAVSVLADRGVTVLAATSRRPKVAEKHLGDAGLRLPAVLVDGAIGIDFRTGERFHEVPFARSAALETLASFRNHGLDPCINVDDPEVDIVVSTTPSTCPAHLSYLGTSAAIRDLETTAAAIPIYAFAVLGLSRDVLGPLAIDLSRDDRTSVFLYPESVYGQSGLIVSAPGVSKWSGVESYCHQHEISAHEVAAVGDGLNDVEMLRQSSVRIGVRGGNEELLDVADYLIGSPDQRGWPEVLTILDGLI